MENESQTKPKESIKLSPLRHFLYESDWTLSRIMAITLQTLLFLATLTLAIMFLALEFYSIVEYREGLSDISTLEAVFVLFAFLLLKRYLAYTKKTHMHWWKKVTTPLLWFGKFVLIAWFATSIVAFADLMQETDYLSMAVLRGENYSQMLAFACILISLYISVPSKRYRLDVSSTNVKGDANTQPESSTASQEEPKQTKTDI